MEQNNYHVSFPVQLHTLLKMSDNEFCTEIKQLVLVKLFELGKISSGQAAKWLEMSRLDFFDLAATYSVDRYNDSGRDALLKDMKNA